MSNQLPTLSTWKGKLAFLAQIFVQHKGLLTSYFLVSLFVSTLNAFIPFFNKLQIDQLEKKHQDFFSFKLEPFWYLVVLLLIPAALELIRMHFFQRAMNLLTTEMERRFRDSVEWNIWEKMKYFDAGFFETRRNLFLMREGFDSSYVVSRFFQLISERYSHLITFFTILPLLLIVDWRLLFVFGLSALGQLIINQRLNMVRRSYTLVENRQDERTWALRNTLQDHFYQVKTQGNVDAMIERFVNERKNQDKLREARYKADGRFDELSWLTQHSALLFSNLYVGYQVLQGNMTIGTFTLAISYSLQLLNFFDSLLSTMQDWQNIDFSFLKLDFFFQLKSRIQRPAQPLALPRQPQRIALEHVSFSYPDFYGEEKAYLEKIFQRFRKQVQKRKSNVYIQQHLEEMESIMSEKHEQRQILKDVSLQVERGEIVALVGRNGSGKTTITHLLQHHYEPDEGKVTLDGQSLTAYDANEQLQQFSWLQQTPFFLDRFSIKENLLFGSPAGSEEEMWKLLDYLLLGPQLRALPKGIDSVIGEDTIPSGGQQQLLSLTRSLLQKRPFIIFDEASSQLDVEKEYLVMQLLQERKKEAGILFITHRMSVARKSDRIYVVDDGKIVEEGKHGELLEGEGLYNQFWKMQVVD
jgi:ABC-type multidrug transport system fused ATPase/permease subunit